MIKLIGKVKPNRQYFDWDLSGSEIYSTAQDVFSIISRVYEGDESFALHTAQAIYMQFVNVKSNSIVFGSLHFNRIPSASDVYMARNLRVGKNIYITALAERSDGGLILLRFVTVKENQAVPFVRNPSWGD